MGSDIQDQEAFQARKGGQGSKSLKYFSIWDQRCLPFGFLAWKLQLLVPWSSLGVLILIHYWSVVCCWEKNWGEKREAWIFPKVASYYKSWNNFCALWPALKKKKEKCTVSVNLEEQLERPAAGLAHPVHGWVLWAVQLLIQGNRVVTLVCVRTIHLTICRIKGESKWGN